MQISIKVEGIDGVKAMLNNLAQKQIPYATALALTRTAQDIKQAEYAEMQKVFDRPTPYTLQSLYLKPATKQSLEAMVYFKEFAGKGTPAKKYLHPEIQGGERNLKRFESALKRVGVLPDGMYITPGSACPLDAYGNIPGSFIVQILSYFRAFGEQGYRANITEKKKQKIKSGTKRSKGFEYFISYGKGTWGGRQHLTAGIYKRTGFSWGSNIKPIFMFVRKPAYKPRFRFYELAKEITNKKFIPNLSLAIHEAKETAR